VKPTRYLAKCKACDCVTSGLSAGQDARRTKGDPQRGGAVYTHANGAVVMDCRQCRQPRRAVPVRGVYRPDHACDSKCMASKGPVCECACGGRNHGASYDGATSRRDPSADPSSLQERMARELWRRGSLPVRGEGGRQGFTILLRRGSRRAADRVGEGRGQYAPSLDGQTPAIDWQLMSDSRLLDWLRSFRPVLRRIKDPAHPRRASPRPR
jgi:hypothetical protein